MVSIQGMLVYILQRVKSSDRKDDHWKTIGGNDARNYSKGIQQPEASWGNMLKEAQEFINIVSRPWLLTPGFLIFVAVLSFNVIGDTIRDVLDPNSKER